MAKFGMHEDSFQVAYILLHICTCTSISTSSLVVEGKGCKVENRTGGINGTLQYYAIFIVLGPFS